MVSSRASAASCSSVFGGMSAPLVIASRSSSGLVGSKSAASSSSRSVSILMPRAKSVIWVSRCSRSHLAWRNSRACASSRTAR